MNLYLVQHAEAFQEGLRPLSEKGLQDIKNVAGFIAKCIECKITAIFHSGKLRARQTAEILAEHLQLVEGVKETDGLEPLADVFIWVNRLQKMQENVMIVGHQPHLSKLAGFLLCQNETKRIINFQMGGVVCLSRDDSGIWSVRWIIIPEILTLAQK